MKIGKCRYLVDTKANPWFYHVAFRCDSCRRGGHRIIVDRFQLRRFVLGQISIDDVRILNV